MSRSVRIADLKANLSAWLRRVKTGETITVMERDTAVAQIVPFEEARPAIRIHRAKRPLSELRLPPRLETKSDIVELLLDERGDR